MVPIPWVQLGERTAFSIVRTAYYAALALMVHAGHRDVAQFLDAGVLGAVIADYITWFARGLMELPGSLLHGGYETCVNVAFAAYFFRVADFHPADDGSTLGIAFFGFMTILGVKLGYYGLQYVREGLTAD